MNPKKLFYASALIASGLLNVAQLGGIADANARPQAQSTTVEKKLGAGAAATFEAFLEAQMCPQVNAEFGTSVCTAETFKSLSQGVCETWDAETSTWDVRSHVGPIPGQWVAD